MWVGASRPWWCPLEPWHPSRLSCRSTEPGEGAHHVPLNAALWAKHLLTGTQMTLPGVFPGGWGPGKGQERDGTGGPLGSLLGSVIKKGLRSLIPPPPPPQLAA